MGAVLVTGGANRIGKEIAVGLAKLGYDIALHYNTTDPATVVKVIQSEGVKCEVFKHDLKNTKEISELMKKVLTDFPELNLLVNNASVFGNKSIRDTKLDDLEINFAVNFFSPFLLSKEFASYCQGSIINILDTNIVTNKSSRAAYLLSKKVLGDFTKMAALEFAPIRVNGIAPGMILPPVGGVKKGFNEKSKSIPLKRVGNVENVVRTVKFLLENDYITGEIIHADGGENL